MKLSPFFSLRRHLRRMLPWTALAWLPFASAQTATEARVALSTWVGRASVGAEDGAAPLARFSGPAGITVDAVGNLTVADTGNATLRRVTTDGTVSTLAGQPGAMGMVDGPGAAARFSTPQHLALDGAGNIYVVDPVAVAIRKITPAGVVSTFALQSLVPTINAPSGLAVTADGQTIYFSDRGNHVIRRLVVADRAITVFAGQPRFAGSDDGVGAAARFFDPAGLALDAAGNLYVADSRNHTIRQIAANGAVTTLAGAARQPGTDDATGPAARFYLPQALALDGAGNLYVADTGNHTLRKITPAGVVSTLAGVAGQTGSADGPGATAKFDFPAALAARPDGTLYVADAHNGVVRQITPTGVVSTLTGTAPGALDATATAARLHRPHSLALDAAGNAYVTDAGNHTIRKITPAGVVSTFAGVAGQAGSIDGPGATARFHTPAGILIDSSGTLYVADAGNHTIRRITPAGVVSTLAGVAGQAGADDGAGAAARFRQPQGLAFDRDGNLIVADTLNNLIRRVTPAGVVSTVVGDASFYGVGSADGTGARAQFEHPSAVAVDASGAIWVADSGNATLRRVAADGTVTTAYGRAGEHQSYDATGTAARFERPTALAFDAAGNLYVADADAAVIRRIAPTGEVLTVAGRAQDPGATDGAGPDARLSQPCGMAFGSDGQLYLVDQGNHALRRGPVATGTPPTITRQPSGVVVYEGSATLPTFTVEATATPATLHYQWQRLPPWGVWTDLRDDGVFSGTTTSTLTIPGITAALNNNQIRCVVDNGFTTTTATNDGVYLLVLPSSSTVHFVNNPAQAEFVCTVTTVAGLAPADGRWGSTWAETDGVGTAARFSGPQAVACTPDGGAYIADTAGGTIRRLAPDGTVTTLAGDGTWGAVDGTGAAARFAGPQALALGRDGNLYVADTENGRLRRVTPAGVVTTLANPAGAPLVFHRPQGLAADTLGNLYVADTDDYTVRRVAADGTVTLLAGRPGLSGNQDGAASLATLGSPGALAVDAAGVVYVLDRGNQTLRKIARDGTVTTLAGSAGESGLDDGIGAAARFNFPSGLAVDARGVLFVADGGNHLLRRVTPDGRVLTIAGQKPAYAGQPVAGATDGAGLAASFRSPWGLALDAQGNLLVADLGNGVIRQVTLRPRQVGETLTFHMNDPQGNPGQFRWQMLAPGAATWVDMTDGGSFSGTTTATLQVTASAALNGYQFRCYTWRPYDNAHDTSGATTFVVGLPPTITQAPFARAVAPGQRATFTVVAQGEPMTFAYRWQRLAAGDTAWTDLADGGAYLGTGTDTLTINPVTLAMRGDQFRCVVDNYTAPQAVSAGAALSVPWSQFAALSARAPVGTGDQALFLGLVFAGGGKPVMFRGIGPGLVKGDASLADQVLADPQLTLREWQTVNGTAQFVEIAANDDWGGTAELRTRFSALGMGALDDASHDAALLLAPTRAVYTAQVGGVGGTTGVALAEAYDANFADKSRRLTALSVRNHVGTGAGMLIAGFVIAGDAPRKVIIRGVGQGLVPQVVATAVLANPTLQLNKLDVTTTTWTVVGANDDWGGTAELTTAMHQAGMGTLAADSKDAVLLLELLPGIYTAQVSGVGDTTGIGLVEIYEAP